MFDRGFTVEVHSKHDDNPQALKKCADTLDGLISDHLGETHWRRTPHNNQEFFVCWFPTAAGRNAACIDPEFRSAVAPFQIRLVTYEPIDDADDAGD